jgi:hypothetical protein
MIMTTSTLNNALSYENRQAPSRSRKLRSVGAVLAGFATIFVASTATDLALRASGVFPSDGSVMSDRLFVLAAAYRTLIGIAGSYLCARLAPRNPMQHALILGGIGTAFGIAGAMAMWGVGPAWYALGVIAITLPSAWAGAKLFLRAR